MKAFQGLAEIIPYVLGGVLKDGVYAEIVACCAMPYVFSLNT